MWTRFDSWHVSFRVSYYKGEPNHTAAISHFSLYYMTDQLMSRGPKGTLEKRKCVGNSKNGEKDRCKQQGKMERELEEMFQAGRREGVQVRIIRARKERELNEAIQTEMIGIRWRS